MRRRLDAGGTVRTGSEERCVVFFQSWGGVRVDARVFSRLSNSWSWGQDINSGGVIADVNCTVGETT
jgi:hypothetical protein